MNVIFQHLCNDFCKWHLGLNFSLNFFFSKWEHRMGTLHRFSSLCPLTPKRRILSYDDLRYSTPGGAYRHMTILIFLCMCGCMHVCMHVRMYACMCACMYVCVYIYIYIRGGPNVYFSVFANANNNYHYLRIEFFVWTGNTIITMAWAVGKDYVCACSRHACSAGVQLYMCLGVWATVVAYFFSNCKSFSHRKLN